VPGNVTSPLCAGSNRLLQSGAYPVLEARDLLHALAPRYHATLSEKQFAEAVQYSAFDAERLRGLGLHLCKRKEDVPSVAEEAPKPKKERKPRKEKAQKGEERVSAPARTPDLSSLTPRERELYAMLPHGPFTVDALTAKGVPISEAASTLTLMEIYGLLASRPGGTFELK